MASSCPQTLRPPCNKAAALNRRMRKTARTVVWEGAEAQSSAPDPISAVAAVSDPSLPFRFSLWLISVILSQGRANDQQNQDARQAEARNAGSAAGVRLSGSPVYPLAARHR